jgi:glycosyltransferase involved in cell wall biosynthesis
MLEHDFDSIADAIIVVGDESTEASYAQHLPDTPLSRVRLSSWEFLESTTDTKDFTDARTKFLYFGGGGLILKGLDLLVEVFSEFTDKELYICGPVANNIEFMDVYETELQQPNIRLVGYTRVGSEKFNDVTANCGYVIHPSASESAGGGVITCMHRGLIPIITPEVIRETGDWGLTLADSRKETIAATVEEASQYAPEKCRQLSRNATQFAQTNHTKETFSDDFTESLTTILETRNS